MYSEKALKHFKNPEHAGELKQASGVGEVGNLTCGDMIRVYIKVGKDGKIEDVKFETYGCVAAIAASDMLCELAKGKTLDEAENLTYKDIVAALGELPPVKFHCSMMGIQALKKAIAEYKKNEVKGIKGSKNKEAEKEEVKKEVKQKKTEK
ncbi:MAG: iron-sulfur cluster assembly scaffold protein [Candidatus Micrarchaeota archaeon]